MFMNFKCNFMVGDTYVSPTIDVFCLENEGYLCASTQDFDDETDASGLFNW